MDSILTSVKLGMPIAEACTDFDTELINCINSVFPILGKIGVQPMSFSITDDDDVWGDYIEDEYLMPLVKEFMKLKVKLLFDPPANSTLIESINRVLSELEDSIYVYCDCQAILASDEEE